MLQQESSIEELIIQGEAFFNAGKIEKAKDHFFDILSLYPSNPTVHNNLGVIEFIKGNYDQALKLFDKSLELDKNHYKALANKADCLKKMGEFQHAVTEYEKIYILYSENIEILNSLGECYISLEDLKSAYEYYSKSFELDNTQSLVKVILEKIDNLQLTDKMLKEYNVKHKKKCIYTFIFNDYDELKDPEIITPGWNYLCMSDSYIGTTVWSPINVSDLVKDVDCPKRKASLLKIEHYKYVPSDYDICVTIDGSMLLSVNLDEFLENYWNDSLDLLIARHPKRDCIYDEAVAVLQFQLDTAHNVFPHMARYIKEGFPPNQGLYGTRMMVKNNKSENLRMVCEIWADEYRKGSRRDQLSLNYAIWKAKRQGIPLKVKEMDFDFLYHKSGMFQINAHKKRIQWQ